jgi:peptidoglycan/xylan/chitin deacetylase (PgdA/CDA1 family)
LLIDKKHHISTPVVIISVIVIAVAISLCVYERVSDDTHKSYIAAQEEQKRLAKEKEQKLQQEELAKEAAAKAAAAKAKAEAEAEAKKPDYVLPPIVNGLAPVVTTLPTKKNIVFLGIDDGAYKDQSVVDLLKQNNIKASLFLSKMFIANNPDFFKQIIAQGSFVEDHTLSHDINMVKESYEQQKSEICGMADYDQQHYGRRPILFRPPGGAYSTTMRKAAADCGMRAIVTWIAKANGGSMQYQIGDHLRPGDIVLLHFRPVFKDDLKAFVDAENAANLHTELIEDAIQ